MMYNVYMLKAKFKIKNRLRDEHACHLELYRCTRWGMALFGIRFIFDKSRSHQHL